MTKAVDMTSGKPFRQIFLFAIPIAIGFFLQNVYTFCDTVIVALSRGSDVMTGINVTGSFSFLVNGFVQGMSAGFGIKLSHFVGAKDENKMRNSLAVSLVLTFIIGSVISVISYISARPVLELMQTEDAYIDYSVSYIRALFLGLLFLLLYNLSDQVLRALGDSRSPVYILLLCAVLNMGLDSLLFITALDAAWAGYATVISQAVSAVVGFIVIFTRFKYMKLSKKDFRFTKRFIVEHLTMGFPMAVQFAITATGCMFAQKAFNALGDPKYVLAQSTAGKIDNAFMSLLNGCGTATGVYIGQNYGAKRFDRIREGTKASLLVGAIFTVFAAVCSLSTCMPIARLIINDGNATEEVFSMIFHFLVIQSSFYYFLLLIHCFRQAVQSIGFSKFTIIGGIIEFAARVVITEVIAVNFGFYGACFCNPLAYVLAGTYFVVCFYILLNKIDAVKTVDKSETSDDSINRTDAVTKSA